MRMDQVEIAGVAALAAGYEVTDSNQWEAFRTALRCFGQHPGALFPTRIWFPAWLLGLGVGLSPAFLILWILLTQAGDGGWQTWLSLIPAFSCGVVVIFAAFVIFPAWKAIYLSPRRPNCIVLCDPGRAFMTVSFERSRSGDSWILRPKDLVAVRRGEHLADAMVRSLLKQVDDVGNIQIRSTAQTKRLGRIYYHERFGFDYGPGRRIAYPPSREWESA